MNILNTVLHVLLIGIAVLAALTIGLFFFVSAKVRKEADMAPWGTTDRDEAARRRVIRMEEYRTRAAEAEASEKQAEADAARAREVIQESRELRDRLQDLQVDIPEIVRRYRAREQ